MSKTLKLATSGLNIAYQRWGEGNPLKVLCLHGWLDNSNSFALLGPHLARNNFEVVAVDHIGHGLSDHLPIPSVFASYVGYVRGVMDALGWDRSHICAHSMGAAISTIYAGCYPERVERMVLIDGMLGINANAHCILIVFVL